MHFTVLLSAALATLANAVPLEGEQSNHKLVRRYQQVGQTQWSDPKVGFHLNQQPVYITGGCEPIWYRANEFFLASGYRLRAYR